MRNPIFSILGVILMLLATAGCSNKENLDWQTANKVWLEQNAKKYESNPNFYITSSGLQYLVLNEGLPTERHPNSTGYVTIHYAGLLVDGHMFDTTNKTAVDFSSKDLVENVIRMTLENTSSSQIQMSNLIKGMQEGLLKMRAPGQAIFFIPQNLAYGKEGSGTPGYSAYIPPYSTLIFKVELLQCYL